MLSRQNEFQPSYIVRFVLSLFAMILIFIYEFSTFGLGDDFVFKLSMSL